MNYKEKDELKKGDQIFDLLFYYIFKTNYSFKRFL